MFQLTVLAEPSLEASHGRVSDEASGFLLLGVLVTPALESSQLRPKAWWSRDISIGPAQIPDSQKL